MITFSPVDSILNRGNWQSILASKRDGNYGPRVADEAATINILTFIDINPHF